MYNRLLTLDLSKTLTRGYIDVTSREKPTSEPTFNDGIMFSSGNSLITYGGFYPPWNASASGARQPNSSVSATRSFNISAGQWSAIDSLPGLAGGAGVSVPGTGRAWYLGGVQDNRTTQGLEGRLAVKGMLEFSGTSVKNLTTPFGGLLGAMMAYIPKVGKEGILVKIGGQTYVPGIVSSGSGMVSMETVDIYDISSGVWYTQNTTGDPATEDGDANGFPKPRMVGCVVAASAPDNSSHHIYMYGGGGRYFGDSFDEVWVLSLPMFRWTQVYGNLVGVYGHTCHLAGERYMLAVGGYRGGCTDLLDIYDVFELDWVNTYYPNKAYSVPAKIVTIIGGTTRGNATVTSPEAGWGSGLETVFRPRTTSKPPQPKSNTPAIAGGVLGGAAVVFSALLSFFLLRRRRIREEEFLKLAAMSSTDQGADAPEHYDGEPTWTPFPQEMEAIDVPKPMQEMEAIDVLKPMHELGDAAAFELQDSSLAIRDIRAGDGAV